MKFLYFDFAYDTILSAYTRRICGANITMQFQHQSLAAGRWQSFTLAEQLGNIGSEVNRAMRARASGDDNRFKNAVYRALELFHLTIDDPRWKGRLKELVRARGLLCDATLGINEYGITLEELDRYFFQYAKAACAKR